MLKMGFDSFATCLLLYGTTVHQFDIEAMLCERGRKYTDEQMVEMLGGAGGLYFLSKQYIKEINI